MTTSLDRVVLYAPGNGGAGCASIHREKVHSARWPRRGNGGAEAGLSCWWSKTATTTLLDTTTARTRKAKNGAPAREQSQRRRGRDVILLVPTARWSRRRWADSSPTVGADTRT